MKPDFSKMSKQELKAYVLTHRDDMEAIRQLFSRRQSDGKNKPYPPLVKDGIPIEENINIMKKAIQERIEKINKSHKSDDII
ncbi:hypothetical protein [Crocosphaera sp.]|uniref:DUF6887 family protein n=1 Tax=Crocosphaera sp. TaxID=2729996 RepID=UPI0026137BB1|nr:hypothetical protein [Crocosphaera sp.]MDJ0580532.1 hypothetical protein [Crocosphaera sp.]